MPSQCLRYSFTTLVELKYSKCTRRLLHWFVQLRTHQLYCRTYPYRHSFTVRCYFHYVLDRSFMGAKEFHPFPLFRESDTGRGLRQLDAARPGTVTHSLDRCPHVDFVIECLGPSHLPCIGHRELLGDP